MLRKISLCSSLKVVKLCASINVPPHMLHRCGFMSVFSSLSRLMTFDCFFLENNLKFRIKKKLLAPMGGMMIQHKLKVNKDE